eukprot:g40105.t1
MSQHRTIALSADKLVRTCFCHLGWCRDRFHLVPLLASASVPRRLSRAGTSFTLHYNVFECYALRGTFIKCKNAKSEGGRPKPTYELHGQWYELGLIERPDFLSLQRWEESKQLSLVSCQCCPGSLSTAVDDCSCRHKLSSQA